MVPAGEPTEQTVTALAEHLQQGDTIIDGGNSSLQRRRSARGGARGSRHPLRRRRDERRRLGRRARILPDDRRPPSTPPRGLIPSSARWRPGRARVPPSRGLDTSTTTAHEGFVYCGPSGAGHFVKMIHNGIEYGLMQSYAEGFDILRNASSTTLPEEHRYNLNLARDRRSLAARQRRQLVAARSRGARARPRIRSSRIRRQRADSGEGRWTVEAAHRRRACPPTC